MKVLEHNLPHVSKKLLPHVRRGKVKELVDLYEPALARGSPFRTSGLNQLYPGYKRVAAIVGDVAFIGMRRATQNLISAVRPDIQFWSYHSTFDHGLPFFGTFHGSDVFQLFTHSPFPNHFVRSCRTYYFNFLYNLDPNKGVGGFDRWPR